ncbi:FAD:protein FMN transferase [Variovorax sp. YR216]|uniref:FAD:protein FMN transferase n=1 Tax=Variovorax sp. YR216 TaxID=1882828 RepID=UPI0008962EC9|nr:FAD:protein FMN transferase [Variovorax sp. YR216]SEB19107.1 thiamine biosynthesis lipoprotein [Variovorax sp. YR216]
MGTTWSVRLDNPSMVPLEAIRAAIEGALDRVIAQMSTWEPGSRIAQFNEAPAGSRHVLEPEFAEVLDGALHWAAASGGAIDPTIGSLVSLWGFGSHASPVTHLPSPSELAAARARVGWQQLQFDGAARTITQPGGVRLDLSGIAKGFSVDRVADSLQALGLRNFLVEVGGEVRCAGRRPFGAPWRVLVEAGPQSVPVALTDMAVATSGNRWHARELDGQRWSHTIDPRTGEPVRHPLVSVTVLHPQCMHADALATVLTVLGPEDGFAFAQRHKLAALFVKEDGGRHLACATDDWAARAQVHAS